MIKSRIHYWSCSKLANLIRGSKKPCALPSEGWEDWRKEQKIKRPIRFWISDVLLNKLQDIVYFPQDVYYTIKYYIKNKYITKTHYLKTALPKGQWYDLDYRILNALFNELVEYVEIELAHLSLYDKNKKYKFKNGKCKEAAYDYFNWAINQTDDYGKEQAKQTKRIKELYEWWTILRPQRQSAIDYITKETHGKNYYKLIAQLEDNYYKEDTEKLIELIKIRGSLWT